MFSIIYDLSLNPNLRESTGTQLLKKVKHNIHKCSKYIIPKALIIPNHAINIH